jgi:alcohol dehydrogenase class IV
MHAMSHPCSAVLDTHHGLTNAVVMPYVLMFNRAEIEDKLTALARYLELGYPSFDSVLEWILELRLRIGIPHTLSHIGVADEHIETLAPMAEIDPSAATNPVPLTKENLSLVFNKAIQGDLGER